MAKYSKKAQDKVDKTMHERKEGTLKSSSGQKVTSRKQAIAIGLSEAREAGAKVPAKPSAGSSRKATKKSATKKSAAKKTSTSSATAAKKVAKKSTAKKSAARKTSPKK